MKIYLLCNATPNSNKDKWGVLLVFASSWTTMSMQTHPFSNSVEALFFTILIYLVLNYIKYPNSIIKPYLIGIVVALGIFTRFTFVIFSFILGIRLLIFLVKGIVISYNN